MLLLIGGQQRAGKDTAYEILKTPSLAQVTLAEPLKELVAKWHGSGKQRDKLIAYGDTARALDPLVFCKLAGAKVRALMAEGYDVAITDCRYPNEFEYFQEHFDSVKTLYIVASQETRSQRAGYTKSAEGHPSEGMLMPKDAKVIRNDGSLQEFTKEVLEWFGI